MANAAQIELTVILTKINCGECGGTYALNERYRAQCAEKGKSWHCPYCQVGWGYSEGENAKLKKELEAEKRRVAFANDQARMERERRESAEARERAQKANVTKIKKRIKNGACPCCNRTFIDLQRHMATKHADYAAAAV